MGTLFHKHGGAYIFVVVETLLGRKLQTVFLNNGVIIELQHSADNLYELDLKNKLKLQ